MKRFEFSPHTADAKFTAHGATLEEAFANAARALYTLMTDIDNVKPTIEKTITIHSRKKQSLLYDFLQQCIILTDTEGFLLHDVKDIRISESGVSFRLQATLAGDTGDYEINTQVKAITYSDMFIKEEKGRVTVQVVPDI